MASSLGGVELEHDLALGRALGIGDVHAVEHAQELDAAAHAHRDRPNAMLFRRLAASATRALVNGLPGGVVPSPGPDGAPFAVLSFTVRGGRIVEIDVLADPARLARLDLDMDTLAH